MPGQRRRDHVWWKPIRCGGKIAGAVTIATGVIAGSLRGGADVIASDNARINRCDDAIGLLTGLLLGTDREVLLFDVNSTDAALGGGDFLTDGTERDLMFGQGNGAQAPDQADPVDSVDNDFDGREGRFRSSTTAPTTLRRRWLRRRR